jgi:hypothetical protein
MIFRAPAGHHLLSKKEINAITECIESGEIDKAKEYLHFLWDEINFFDSIRQATEEKKMLKEEQRYAKARMLESEIRVKMKIRVKKSKQFKEEFLN